MYNSEEIAKRIRLLVAQQGITIGKMLAECNLGVNTVSKIGKGKDINTLNFAKIADYLGCSVDYLLGRTDFISLIPENISPEEMKLISCYRQLNQEGQKKVMRAANDLATIGKYEKTDGIGKEPEGAEILAVSPIPTNVSNMRSDSVKEELTTGISDDERELLELFGKLTYKEQQRLIGRLQDFDDPLSGREQKGKTAMIESSGEKIG